MSESLFYNLSLMNPGVVILEDHQGRKKSTDANLQYSDSQLTSFLGM